MADASRPQIYLITPPLKIGDPLSGTIVSAVSAVDVACVLLRVGAGEPTEAKKMLRELVPAVQSCGAAALVEDVSLAARIGADGVHVSMVRPDAEDLLEEAMAGLKPERVVGAGGLATRHASMQAGEAGVDYVMFGEMTGGLAADREAVIERVRWWSEIFTPPCVAFCAEEDEVEPLTAAGAEFLAPGDWLWRSRRSPTEALREFAERIEERRGS